MDLQINKLALAYPNYIDKAMVSGGSYEMTLPLINVQNKVLARRARSVDLLPASTKFDLELDRLRTVAAFSIASHNFSTTAEIRVRVYKDIMQTILLYDSGIIKVWPAIFDSVQDLEWEYDNYWFGTLGEDERESFTPLFTLFFNVVIAQSVKVEIFDEDNMDGYVEFGRVFVSDVFQPNINMEYGVQFGYENTTEVETALDRTEYFDVKRQKRTMSCVLGSLSEKEAFNKLYTMKRDLGISEEILIAFDLDQASQTFNQKTFLARNASIDPITHPFLSIYSTALNFKEIT